MPDHSKKELLVFLTLAASVFAYILIRAYLGPIIHDEAETYFIYIQSGKFIPPDSFWDANNHLFNSLLTYISYLTFGNSVFALRLPNVLSFIVFAYYVFKTGVLVNDRVSRWFLYLSMLFTHFILEFFAYTRGYGLGLSFLFASVYYLLLFAKSSTVKKFFLHTLFMIIAVLSNMALINSLVIAQALVWLIILIKERNNIKLIIRTGLIQLLLVLPIIALFTIYAFALQEHGALYYGSLDGFWDMTVVSLSKMFFRFSPIAFRIVILAVTLFAIVILVLKWRESKVIFIRNTYSLIYPALLLGNIIFTIALSEVMKVNYPEDRVATYFYIMFIGSAAFIAGFEQRKYRYLLFLTLPLVLIQFTKSANPKFSSYFPEYKIPSAFYDFIENETAKKEFPPTVEAYPLYRTEWAYYNMTRNNKLGVLQYEGYPTHTTDYLITKPSETPDWEKNYRIIDKCRYSDLMLLQRKDNIQYSEIASFDSLPGTMIQNKWFRFGEIVNDSLKGNSFRFNIGFKLETEARPFDAAIFVKALDKFENELAYSVVNLSRSCETWNKAGGISQKVSLVLPHLPLTTHKIIIFLMNSQNSDYVLHSYSVKALRIN